MAELYDTIGQDYDVHRRPDPRIAATIVVWLVTTVGAISLPDVLVRSAART